MRKVYVLLATFENGSTFIAGVLSNRKKAEYILNVMKHKDPNTNYEIKTEVIQ